MPLKHRKSNIRESPQPSNVQSRSNKSSPMFYGKTTYYLAARNVWATVLKYTLEPAASACQLNIVLGTLTFSSDVRQYLRLDWSKRHLNLEKSNIMIKPNSVLVSRSSICWVCPRWSSNGFECFGFGGPCVSWLCYELYHILYLYVEPFIHSVTS